MASTLPPVPRLSPRELAVLETWAEHLGLSTNHSDQFFSAHLTLLLADHKLLEAELNIARQVYYCPVAREMEHPELGGFDVCCDQPERHVGMPKIGPLA